MEYEVEEPCARAADRCDNDLGIGHDRRRLLAEQVLPQSCLRTAAWPSLALQMESRAEALLALG
jgi:hypothetical protein